MGPIVFLNHFDENIVHAWHNRVKGYHFDVGNYALKQLIAFRWANGLYLYLGNRALGVVMNNFEHIADVTPNGVDIATVSYFENIAAVVQPNLVDLSAQNIF